MNLSCNSIAVRNTPALKQVVEQRRPGLATALDPLHFPFPPCLPRSPALLALQQLAVGGDLHIQGQLGVHQILVVTQQPGQVLAGFLQSLFQLTQLALGVFEGILSPLLSICNGVLYTLTLGEK